MIAKLKGATKEYKTGDQTIVALQPTDVEISKGELVLILGPSGSGKTTLLSLIGCVIYPTRGDLFVNGEHINKMSEKKLAALRLHSIGFVFQNFNLIAPLNAFDNVAMPLQLAGISSGETKRRTTKALEMVGMMDRAGNLPKQLSGGQQQRVAVARALVSDPEIVLCDEPTASLDKDSLATVMEELQKLAKSGKAVAVVTHDPRLKAYADRILEVENGFVTEVEIEK